jgi:GGDEF domain-containing protein
MLKIEEMNFLDFNLSAMHTFKALCDWIAAAYVNAQVHKSGQIEDEATQLYGMTFLERQTEYMTHIAGRFGFDLTLLFYRIDVADLSEDERRQIPAILGTVARRVLRRTDLTFSHEPPGTQFAVLLPGAPPEHAVAVTQKLSQGMREAWGREIPYTTSVQVLSRAADAATRPDLRASADLGESDSDRSDKVA